MSPICVTAWMLLSQNIGPTESIKTTTHNNALLQGWLNVGVGWDPAARNKLIAAFESAPKHLLYHSVICPQDVGNPQVC